LSCVWQLRCVPLLDQFGPKRGSSCPLPFFRPILSKRAEWLPLGPVWSKKRQPWFRLISMYQLSLRKCLLAVHPGVWQTSSHGACLACKLPWCLCAAQPGAWQIRRKVRFSSLWKSVFWDAPKTRFFRKSVFWDVLKTRFFLPPEKRVLGRPQNTLFLEKRVLGHPQNTLFPRLRRLLLGSRLKV